MPARHGYILTLVCVTCVTRMGVAFFDETVSGVTARQNGQVWSAEQRQSHKMAGPPENEIVGGRRQVAKRDNFILDVDTGDKCPEHRFCKCFRKTREMICGGNISYIPPAPSYITTLIMRYACLVNLTKDTFTNIRNIRLTKLEISSSGVTNISPDAFSNIEFSEGGALDLSGNAIVSQQLKDAFCGSNFANLSSLNLDNMTLHILPNDLFVCFNESELQTLNLRNNWLNEISGLVFVPVKSMRALYLTRNNINSIRYPEGFKKLAYLELRWNNFTRVPNFGMDSAGNSITQCLQTLDLGSNHIISIQSSDFKGLANLHYLHVKFNYIAKLSDNLLAEMPNLVHVSFQHNLIRKISSSAFNSSSLTYLSLADNSFHFSTADTKNLFRLCPQLDTLYLSDNYLDISDQNLVELFSPLRNLTRLILEKNRMREVIPPPLLKILPSLQELILSSNTISSWNPEMFLNAKYLTKLFLDNNAISSVNETSFPQTFLSQLKSLNLASNPFACTCDLRWFLRWIKATKSTKIVNYPTQYKCTSPGNWQGKHLSEFNPTDEYCANKTPNFRLTIGCILGGIALLGTLSTVIIIKYRLHIRYCFYVVRSQLKRRGYTEIADGCNYLHDAFVVYSAVDRAWVVRHLLPRVENEGLKLCLYDRDFLPGTDIVDNIMDNMHASRKVILVLSDNFAESDWCKWELTMAQHKLLDEKREILILVKLSDIKAENMTNRLMLLMRDKVYIDWSDQELGQELFWKRLLNALAVLSEPSNV